MLVVYLSPAANEKLSSFRSPSCSASFPEVPFGFPFIADEPESGQGFLGRGGQGLLGITTSEQDSALAQMW